MFKKMRQALLMLNASAERRQNVNLVRKVGVLAAKLLRSPSDISARLAGLSEIAEQHAQEVSTWVDVKSIEEGVGGAFDACDLRHWLALAERAGVPYVPAREVLSLKEHELGVLSGFLKLNETAVTRSVQKNLHLLDPHISADPLPDVPEIDFEELVERLHAAMDDLPEGWMVRYARCGSSELKALAGSGLSGPEAPEVKFGTDVEVGPGWVRTGNRRRVHVSDNRTIESAAEGPGGDAVFLARPWVKAARYFETEDPHRHGTMFAGKGVWPAEWRAFVLSGQVVGVSCYYAWCGEVTEENARVAMEVREKAQAIVDEALSVKAWPRYMDVEFVRLSKNDHIVGNPLIQNSLEALGRETVSCTLDFIETEDGLMLLEGGPANTPFGGGHPCAFAGFGGKPTFGNVIKTEGVAFRLMPNVILADISTWDEGDATGCILSWDEVADLANTSLLKP